MASDAGITILSMEDDPTTRKIMVAYLRDQGFQVLAAENGRVGLEMYHRQRPDLVLVDLLMPEVDGFEVVSHITEESPDTPVIVVSAVEAAAEAVEALHLGAWDYVVKPPGDMTVLLHAVQKALDRARLIQQGRDQQQHLEEEVNRRTAELKQLNEALIREVEERTAAEEALRRSEERYALAQKAANIGSWDRNIRTGELQWSEQIEPMFGFDPGEFDGTYETFLERIHPEDREFVVESVRDAIDEDAEYDVEHRVAWPDGTVRWVSETGAVLRDENGTALRMLGVVRDITDRKRAEDALKGAADVVQAIPSGLFIYRYEPPDRLYLVYGNPAAQRLTGIRVDEWLGREFNQIWPQARDLGITEAFLGPMRTGETYDTEDMHYEDERLTGDFRTRAFRMPGDRLGVAFENISERKRAEQEKLTAQRELLDLQRRERERIESELDKVRAELIQSTRLATIGQMSAQVAHDIRNPLGAVQNAVFYLQRRVPPQEEKWNEYLELIQREIDSCNRIITSLLDVTRRRAPARETLDLVVLVEDAVRRLKTPAGVQVRCSFQPMPFPTYVDRIQWRQVMDNLLKNAVDAVGPAGQIDVRGESAQGFDVIEVHDTGPGIEPARRETVFEMFHTTKAKGTGLGLSICRQIVERHGGTIDVADDDGATLRIRLPHKG